MAAVTSSSHARERQRGRAVQGWRMREKGMETWSHQQHVGSIKSSEPPLLYAGKVGRTRRLLVQGC